MITLQLVISEKQWEHGKVVMKRALLGCNGRFYEQNNSNPPVSRLSLNPLKNNITYSAAKILEVKG